MLEHSQSLSNLPLGHPALSVATILRTVAYHKKVSRGRASATLLVLGERSWLEPPMKSGACQSEFLLATLLVAETLW